MQPILALTLFLMFLPVAVTLAFIPHLTRETVSFGVSVSEEHYRSEPLRQMRRTYALISLTISALLLIPCLYALLNWKPEVQPHVIGAYVTAMIIVSAIMNLTFYFKMKKLRPTLADAPASQEILAVDTAFRRQKLVLSGKWFLVHCALIIAGTVFVLVNYDKIPDPIALKFDLQGQVVRSAAKSYRTVLFPGVMQTVMTLLFFAINWSIQRSKQQSHSGDPERSLRQNIVFRRRWSLFTLVSGLVMVLTFAFIQLNMIYPQQSGVILLVSAIMPAFVILFAVILTFTTGQGGSRINRPGTASPAKPVKDDAYWKLGFLYFNPQDPSIFVEKRMGVGWTINFAHPLGWILLIGIIVVIAGAGAFFGHS